MLATVELFPAVFVRTLEHTYNCEPLEAPFSLDNELKKRLNHQSGENFRSPPSIPFEHFTGYQKAHINLVINTLVDFMRTKFNNTYGIEEYVRTD